jgi:hypothetical protein
MLVLIKSANKVETLNQKTFILNTFVLMGGALLSVEASDISY